MKEAEEVEVNGVSFCLRAFVRGEWRELFVCLERDLIYCQVAGVYWLA